MARTYDTGWHLGPRQRQILQALADRPSGLTVGDLAQLLAGDQGLYDADPQRWMSAARDSVRSLMLRRYAVPLDADAHTGSWHLTHGRWIATPAGLARLTA